MLLGVHCSVSGGLANAFKEAETLGINTFQIFTKNQRQWREKVIDPKEAEQYKKLKKDQQIALTLSHSSYLINLASDDSALQERSRSALIGELNRCTDLGLAFTVLHPGSARDQPVEEAIGRIAKGLRHALDATRDSKVKIALETMAGQGTSVGRSFEELKMISDLLDHDDRIVFCFDTCHVFAAGYDIRTESGIAETLEKWDKIIGIERIACLHLNDSKGELASNVDRHTHIGLGEIGDEPFKYLMRNYPDIPKIIETPKEDDWDAKNLERLKSFV